MRVSQITLAGLLAAGFSSAQPAKKQNVQCASGLKMFVSRGTNEAPGLGANGDMVNLIKSQIPGSEVTAIDYPASYENPVYFDSVYQGTKAVKKAVTDYANACPNSKIAVFGYSQGAQVTSNAFCGAPVAWALNLGATGNAIVDVGDVLATSSPLPSTATKNVVAVVLFGDPTHRSNTGYTRGTATGNGIFYRPDSQACKNLGKRIRSYCDFGDPFCDAEAPPSLTAHGTYQLFHSVDVVPFVIQQYQA